LVHCFDLTIIAVVVAISTSSVATRKLAGFVDLPA